jgi:hypothetical protein
MKTTTIHGYRVEFDIDENEITQCFILTKNASSSLSFLLNMGGLQHSDDREEVVPVSEETINKIEAWAMAAGY